MMDTLELTLQGIDYAFTLDLRGGLGINARTMACAAGHLSFNP
jgi:hypothetical protein